MTIKQYQTLAKTIASKIEKLGGNPRTVRNLHIIGTGGTIFARDPKKYNDKPCSYVSGETNVTIAFDTISNPNNPNYKFRTLKPGSISFYDSKTNVNADLSDYNFDTAQFADMIEYINYPCWSLTK